MHLGLIGKHFGTGSSTLFSSARASRIILRAAKVADQLRASTLRNYIETELRSLKSRTDAAADQEA